MEDSVNENQPSQLATSETLLAAAQGADGQPGLLSRVLAAKADEHDRVQRELRAAERRAENQLQEKLATQWVEAHVPELLLKLEKVAIKGGRSYRFDFQPDPRYQDCSGAWYVALSYLQEFLADLGIDACRDGHRFPGTVVRVSW